MIPVRIRWPVIIVTALALHVVAWLGVVYLATSNPSYAVEEDYYAKALAWDARRAQERTNADLGWRLETAVEAPATAGADAVLTARLSDRDGHPLEGASIALETFHNARAHEVLRGALSPGGGGVYRIALPMRRDGRWELRYTVDLADRHFTHSEVRHLVVSAPIRAAR